MNFSLPPMLLYGIILFSAIATGMENKESDQVAPNVIEIKGRIELNSDVINGYYFKADELHNERVYYHNQYKSCYILWNQTFKCWYIYHQDIGSMALLEEDVLFPTLAEKYWIFDYGAEEEWNVDENVVVEKIDIKNRMAPKMSRTLILKDPRILTVTLKPQLELGLTSTNWTTGEGIEVNYDENRYHQEVLEQLGTGKDWQIILVDFEPYNEPLLDEKINGDKSYQLSFIKKLKQKQKL